MWFRVSWPVYVVALAALAGALSVTPPTSAPEAAAETPPAPPHFSPPEPEHAEIRFVDVGPGLCVVGSFPGGQHFLYDAGGRGNHCRAAVAELVYDRTLELVVISHPDADHIQAMPAILGAFAADRIVHPGHHQGSCGRYAGTDRHHAGTCVWQDTLDAIERQRRRTQHPPEVIDMGVNPIAPGHRFELGEATVTFVAGWSHWDQSLSPPGPNLTGHGLLRNVISLVVRVEYGGRSVLLTGDTKGRLANSPPEACLYAQAFMLRNTAIAPLRSDIMLSAHHGADNGDAPCFIREAAPDYVVISAGHHEAYRHPRATAAGRYLSAGIPAERIFRTDRGDDEGPLEWDYLRLPCRDGPGDDDVVVRLSSDPREPLEVRYRIAENLCSN